MQASQPVPAGQVMRVMSRSILVVCCLLLVLTVGSRAFPWSLSSSAPAVPAPTAPSTTVPAAYSGMPQRPSGIVVQGPAVVTTKCHERGLRLVCHTYLAPSSGVALDHTAADGAPPSTSRR